MSKDATQAFTTGIHSTDLSPPRNGSAQTSAIKNPSQSSSRSSSPDAFTKHHQQSKHPLALQDTVELALTRTDSSSSSTVDVEFESGPASTPVRMLVTDTTFMDMGITGSLGLVPEQPNCSSPGSAASGRSHGSCKPPKHYIVLLNRRSGAPLAVCALKADSGSGRPVVRIYATKRRVFGQRPAATTRKLGLDWSSSLPLFAWAEIVTERRSTTDDRIRYSIYMASGSDGRFEEVPSYKGEQHCVGGMGAPEILIVGRTEREHSYTGCAVLCLNRDEDAKSDSNFFFRLSIAKGVDPALMLCFAAFVDEAMEKTMRAQYQHHHHHHSPPRHEVHHSPQLQLQQPTRYES